MPLLEQNPEEECTSLQAHKKRARNFHEDEDEEAEVYAPPLKRPRTEQPVLPLPGSATHGGHSDVLPQVIPVPPSPPYDVPPQVDQCSRAPQDPHKPFSQTRSQKLDAEWAQIFGQNFVDLGFQSTNHSEVPPWNDEEVQVS